MLNINNKNDINEMMKYHRTRDMINLLKFFPDLSPVRNLTIVKSIEDYIENYEFCKSLSGERNDSLITKPVMKSISTSGKNQDIIGIFKKVKMIDPMGVLVLFDLINSPSERYERYAGISVAVRLENDIWIEAVGKGFDGREVSVGIACHERYYIPWHELRKCNIANFKDYRIYIVDEVTYYKSRCERIEFLVSLGLDRNIVCKGIPEHYSEIPDFIWCDVIRNLLKKLECVSDELSSVGLNEFVVSGHTEGRRFLPWQMYTSDRYGKVVK